MLLARLFLFTFILVPLSLSMGSAEEFGYNYLELGRDLSVNKFDNLIATDCPSGNNFVKGVQSNGTVLCEAGGGGGAGGGNTTEEIQDAVGAGAGSGGGAGGFGDGLTYNDDGNYFNHSDTSNQSSSDNSGSIVIQDIILDTLGHLTSIVTVDFNATGFIQDWNWTGFIRDWGSEIGEDIHVHDQDLNTTSNVTFYNATIEGNLNATNFVSLQGDHNMQFTSSGENAILNFLDVGGPNYLELATTGGFFQLYGNPGPANDYLLATITETQGADTELNFYEGGTTHNRFWDSGSARFGGGASHLCTNITDFVDCDTSGTGADVVVQDDIYAGGQFIGNTTGSWSNVSINESQIYNFGVYRKEANHSFSNNISFNDAVTGEPLGVPNKINLWGGVYGFGIAPAILDLIVPATGIFRFNNGSQGGDSYIYTSNGTAYFHKDVIVSGHKLTEKRDESNNTFNGDILINGDLNATGNVTFGNISVQQRIFTNNITTYGINVTQRIDIQNAWFRGAKLKMAAPSEGAVLYYDGTDWNKVTDSPTNEDSLTWCTSSSPKLEYVDVINGEICPL